MQMRRFGYVVAAAAIALAGCSSNTNTSTTTTTAAGGTTTAKPASTTPQTTPGSTPGSAVKGIEVPVTFGTDATEAQATQAAEVMVKRLTNYGFPGSTAEVNSAEDGLDIMVAGATSEEQALQILQVLRLQGALYFRPVLQGPIAPASGETPAPETAKVMEELSPGSTVPAAGIATTPAADDKPTGESVLIQPNKDDQVIARWKVGPSQVDATAVSDAKATTLEGKPAVQIVMKSGSPGIDQFNALAKNCVELQPTCPTRIYTVVFDSLVLTGSTFPSGAFTPFTTTNVIINSPDWTQEKAKAIAAVITVGELPVPLVLDK